ncbi:hypothetical protein K435DRAFT_777513 [Dendrothele bispora CBS 962.96]|uniref:Uncharacterized protein n=1 Tax=Dendrothele bispora (strain CBS 962.96) TaxID=1314807 RepID=A0A4S8M7R4_DENBC|nr:hypothetical protein K435DRAFT_777513 [Dendrothele bispora CBS 962.96]
MVMGMGGRDIHVRQDLFVPRLGFLTVKPRQTSASISGSGSVGVLILPDKFFAHKPTCTPAPNRSITDTGVTIHRRQFLLQLLRARLSKVAKFRSLVSSSTPARNSNPPDLLHRSPDQLDHLRFLPVCPSISILTFQRQLIRTLRIPPFLIC